ncbi:MAG: hypothetical protein RL266_433 [Bacteroidota bacterium]|jgi:hypothetical protein
MKRIFTLFALSSTLLFSGCDEDFEDAPFRCKISGKEFSTSDELLTVTVSGGNNYYIQATRVANPLNDDLYGEIKLDIVVDSVGTYPLNLQNTWRWSNNGGQTYRANGIEPGTVTITQLDQATKRISGTFELVAVGDDNTTKTVTEGFFDSDWN